MKHRILVVDDEPMIRSLLRRKMEQEGHEVVEAADGRKAIRCLQESEFDLVIADILMPEQDGLEVIMYLQREQPDVKIIAVTGLGNQLYLACAEKLGAARVFSKPFELSEVAAAAGELLPQ